MTGYSEETGLQDEILDMVSSEVMVESEPLTQATSNTIAVAKAEESALKEQFDLIVQRYLKLKSVEISLEELIIKTDHTLHPDLRADLEAIRTKSSTRLNIAKTRHEKSKTNAYAIHNSSVRLAQDTFFDGCKRIKKRLLDEVSRVKFQVDAENSKVNINSSSVFSQDANTYSKKRKESVSYSTLAGTHLPETNGAPYPAWVRDVAKFRRSNGKTPVCIPLPCSGLNSFDRSDDVHIIKAMAKSMSTFDLPHSVD
ncbi:hypothetical protein BC829DRAFT_407850 [Chytridium lagenaria]|nr:hypothetical protein BC829DRAFT_407850 [Chytridium lagenaria]